MAACEVSRAAPTPENHPTGSSAGPALSLATGEDDSHAAGTPRYPRRAGEGSASHLFPLPGSHPCWLQWDFCGCGEGCLGGGCFDGVGSPREIPGGFGLGLAPWGWGPRGEGGGLPTREQGVARREEPHAEAVRDAGVQGITFPAEGIWAQSYNPRYNHQNLTRPTSPREGALTGLSHSPADTSAGRSCRVEGRR